MLRFIRYICRAPEHFGPDGPIESSMIEIPDLWTKSMAKVAETAYRNHLARKLGQAEEPRTQGKWESYKAELKAGIVAEVYAALGRPGEDGPQREGAAEKGKGKRAAAAAAASKLVEMMELAPDSVWWWRDNLEGKIDSTFEKINMPVLCNAALQDEVRAWQDVGPALSQVSPG